MTAWVVVLCAAGGAASGWPLERIAEQSALAVKKRSAVARDAESDREVTTPVPQPSAAGTARAAALALALAIIDAAAGARLGTSWALVPAVVSFAGLTTLAWCDGRHFVLPRRVLYPVLAATALAELVASLAAHDPHRLLTAVICGAVAFAAFFLMNLISPRAMAFGDVRLAGAVGLLVGWYGARRALAAFVIATLLAAVASIVLLATRRASLRSALPYGVFLVMGTVVAVLA